MRQLRAGWETWLAAAIAAFSAVLMPANFYASAVSEIVTILGFLIAAFVPAMILAATTLRAGGFSILRIRALGDAIKRQVQLFGGLFLYALAACSVLVMGKTLAWRLPSVALPRSGLSVDLSFIFPAFLNFIFVFLIFRSFVFIEAVSSLLDVTVKIAEDEARVRDKEVETTSKSEFENYRMPEGYGTTIDDPPRS